MKLLSPGVLEHFTISDMLSYLEVEPYAIMRLTIISNHLAPQCISLFCHQHLNVKTR